MLSTMLSIVPSLPIIDNEPGILADVGLEFFEFLEQF
jgi:hypothetical protein